MTKQAGMTMSLRNRLTFWFSCLLTIVGIGSGIVAYELARLDPDSFLDDQLRQIAIYAGDRADSAADPSKLSIDASDIIVVQVWDAANRTIRTTPQGFDLPKQSTTGFSNVTLRDEAWRTYTLVGPDRTVQVSQRAAVRDEIALNAAWTAMIPSLLLIPIGWLVVRWLVGRMLKPIVHLADELNNRGPLQFSAPPLAEIPVEVLPLVRAMTEAFARLHEAILLQRRFISDAAHQFRTPLAALRLQIGNLSAGSAADRQEVVADMNIGVRRMSTLVNQLLALARSESPQQTAAAETEVSLAAAMREVVAAILPLAQDKGVELAMREDTDACIIARPDDVITMLSNVVDNAVRYNRPGGRVELSATSEGDQAVVAVSDNGPGLPEDMLTAVFGRFVRNSDTEEGSGLGLAIAAAIAGRLGGSISLTNRTDSGLSAVITLPRAQ
jgi:two-component system OmpR family sensor kinase